MSRRISIGNLILENRFILAPMAGVTDTCFRSIVKKFGASLVTTEMISAKGLCYKQKSTYEYLKHCPEEKPISVQIFGSEPEIMADAAQIVVEKGADIVDINMGCPVKKVVKTGAGGSLLRDLKRVERILKAVRKVCNVPLTIKIRPGWSPEDLVVLDLIKIAEECGVDAITVHPRFVIQGFSGKADWSIIAQVKERSDVTIIGNGDIFSAEDAMDMIKKTGCDAVMIARGAIGNPWIFKEALALEKGNDIEQVTWKEKKRIMMEHYILAKKQNKPLGYMKKIFIWYTKGLPYSNLFRQNIGSIKKDNELIRLLNSYFSMLEEKIEGKSC